MLIAPIRRACRRALLVIILAVSAVPAFADGGVDIAKVAPARSFLVVNIPDFSQFRAAFEKSDLGTLWREPSVESFIEELTKDQTKQFGDFLKEVGIKAEDLKPPTGQTGLALFMPEADKDAAPEADGKRKPEPPPEILIVADMGPNAESLQDSLDRLIDRGVKDKKITTEEDTYAGAKITTVKPIVEKKDTKPENGKEDDDESDDADQPVGMQNLLGGPLTRNRDLQIARSGSEFMICTNRKAVEAALDSMTGRAGETVGDSAVYRDSLGQHPSNSIASAVLIAGPLIEMLRNDLASNIAEGDRAAAGAVFDAAGVSSIRSASIALRMETPEAMVDCSMAVLAPEKKGFLSLFAQPLGAFDPPGFVPPDAATVSRFSFKFNGVFDVLRSIAAALPEQQRTEFTSSLDQTANIVKPLLDVIGPSVYWFTTYKQPLASDSEQTSIVIDTTDQAAVSNAVLALSGQIGLESRDFEGNTIFSSEGFPIAIGIGFNRIFYGSSTAVENAMRLAGHADAPKLSAEPAFREATRSLSDDSVVASFSDTHQAVRWMYWMWQNWERITEEQLNASQVPEDRRDEILKSLRERHPEWQDHLPPLDVILSHLGDTASDLRATPDGFRGRTIMLKPTAK